MGRKAKVPHNMPKPKRIRKKPDDALRPFTYASRRTDSWQKNPIVYVSIYDRVYVLRKWILVDPFAEDQRVPCELMIDVRLCLLAQRAVNDNLGYHGEERIWKANLGTGVYKSRCADYGIGPNTSLFNFLTEDARTALTVYLLCRRRLLPTALATVEPGATHFHHVKYGLQEIHCMVEFVQGSPYDLYTFPATSEETP